MISTYFDFFFYEINSAWFAKSDFIAYSHMFQMFQFPIWFEKLKMAYNVSNLS